MLTFPRSEGHEPQYVPQEYSPTIDMGAGSSQPLQEARRALAGASPHVEMRRPQACGNSAFDASENHRTSLGQSCGPDRAGAAKRETLGRSLFEWAIKSAGWARVNRVAHPRPRRRLSAWWRWREIHSRTPYPSANPMIKAIPISNIGTRHETLSLAIW